MMMLGRTACFVCLAVASAAPLFAQDSPGDKPAQAKSQPEAELASHQPDAGMLRYPDISATQVVFVYANDLWVAPREGGLASPLASPSGQERNPKFSPDGQRIAFVGNYEGNSDIYTIPVSGGVPTRVTYHPATETLCDWTAQDKLLFFSNAFTPLSRQTQLLVVSPAGGLPENCPTPYGANGAISEDGKWLAYTPHSRDHRTWKRYRGGMATDIWLLNLKDKSSKRISDWEGTDTLPMFHGDKVYYLSDAGAEHRLNIWSYDMLTGAREQITELKDFDVKWPSMGPGPGKSGAGEIVFQYGPSLTALDLATRKTRRIDVTIPGAQATLRPRRVDASKFITDWEISPSGKRAVVEARGDIWTLPAKNGPPRNLTRTSGVAERDPSWSPDGRWIAYFSDATGEYELYITQSDGKGPTKRLTKESATFYYSPTWSPDSRHIAFSDKAGGIHICTVATGNVKQVDTDPWAVRQRVSWSPNSQWLAYSKNGANRVTAIWLYELQTGRLSQVTSGMFNDTWPTFDRSGKFLFFASNRKFTSPIYEDVGTSFIYANTDILMAAPLREGIDYPWAPTSDEESFPGRKAASTGPKESKSYIDIDGFEQRAFMLPVKQGSFMYLAPTSTSRLVYVRGTPKGDSTPASVKILDLRSRSESTVIDGISTVKISSDGRKLIARKGSTLGILDASASQNLSAVPTAGMTEVIDPRAEWKQLFTDAWRIERDYFYDPHMHGVDWAGVRERYEPMLNDCTVREDVSFVIGEMISELNVGHAYVRNGGDVEKSPSVNVGMLGVDYKLHDGAYRISQIHEGAPWDFDARSPFRKAKGEAKVGDYLLAVNGIAVDVSQDPWAAFQGLAGKATTITLSTKPKLDASARDLIVTPVSSELSLRYRGWIEKNRKFVAEKTGGKSGYIYVPDTGTNGQNDLVRQFFGQRGKAALVIDERWNGGGQIPTRFIELLDRPVTNYWARRDGEDWRWPPDAHQGPKCMLINGLAGSGGDAFPAYFRQRGLGKLIGMRTWGGLVGISGNPALIDGGYISAPTFAFYENDGTWGIEGHGVDPDIEVVDDPALMQNGADPQLTAAVEYILGELKRSPYQPPKRPEYPNRSGLGIRAEDK